MKASVQKKTLDNITVVMVSFESFKKKFFPSKKKVHRVRQSQQMVKTSEKLFTKRDQKVRYSSSFLRGIKTKTTSAKVDSHSQLQPNSFTLSLTKASRIRPASSTTKNIYFTNTSRGDRSRERDHKSLVRIQRTKTKS